MLSEPWRVYLLGTFRFKSGNRDFTQCATRKTEELLGLLAYRLGQQVSRTEVMDRFWMESEFEAAQVNLRVALSSLRKQLEPTGVPAGSVIVSHGRTCISLNPEAVTCDAVDFRRLLKSKPGQTPEDRIQRLLAAIDLYKGELMPGHNEEWIEEIRNNLAEMFYAALREVSTSMAASGEMDRALEHAHRAVAEDPLREEAHCELMRLLALAGRPEEAVRAYEHMTRLFEREEMGPPSRQAWRIAEQARASMSAPTDAAGLTMPTSGTRPSSPTRSPEPPVQPVRRARPAPPEPETTWTPVEPEPPPAPVPKREAPPYREGGNPNLPMQFTRFFGREPELRRLSAFVESGSERLITLIGPGGTGKTRLAVEFATRQHEAHERRVVFVPLADATNSQAAIVKIAEVLQVPIRPGADLTGLVERDLAAEPTLLVLDNFEQLVDEMAPLILRLISNVGALCIIVTTRHALDLTGEQLLPVEPLPVPERAASPEDIMAYAGVQLFVDRATRALPDFAVTPRNASDIAEVCRRLEGLPLSLELAAAWAQDRSPKQMLRDLGRKFELLVSRKRDVPDRHATLQACLEWSYRLLPERLARAFASLGVFRGGFTVEATEEICRWPQAVTTLQELRSRSLITVDRSGDEPRYGMLEAIQAFAEEKLDERDRSELASRHAAYFAAICAEAEPSLWRTGQSEAIARLSVEIGNIQSALGWSLEHDAARGVRMGRDLGRFWVLTGRRRDGRDWLTRCAEVADAIGDTAGRGAALCLMGPLCAYEGDAAEAIRHAQSGADLLRGLGDAATLARGLVNLGVTLQTLGEVQKARSAYEESRELAQAAREDPILATVLTNLAGLCLLEGDCEAAKRMAAEGISLARRLGDHWLRGMLLVNLGDTACEEYDAPNARDHYVEALPLLTGVGDLPHAALVLRQLAAVVAYQEDHASAAVLLGAAEAAQEASGTTLPEDHAEDLEATEAAVRKALSVAAYERARARGCALRASEVPQWLAKGGASADADLSGG